MPKMPPRTAVVNSTDPRFPPGSSPARQRLRAYATQGPPSHSYESNAKPDGGDYRDRPLNEIQRGLDIDGAPQQRPAEAGRYDNCTYVRLQAGRQTLSSVDADSPALQCYLTKRAAAPRACAGSREVVDLHFVPPRLPLGLAR